MLLLSVAMKRKMERQDLKAMDFFVKIENGIDNEFIFSIISIAAPVRLWDALTTYIHFSMWTQAAKWFEHDTTVIQKVAGLILIWRSGILNFYKSLTMK